MTVKSVHDMTVDELKKERHDRNKELRKHYAINRDKHARTPEEREHLLNLMRTLYRL